MRCIGAWIKSLDDHDKQLLKIPEDWQEILLQKNAADGEQGAELALNDADSLVGDSEDD